MALDREFNKAQESVPEGTTLADAITAAKVMKKANLDTTDVLSKVLVGQPCSGKTTAALEYIQDMIEQGVTGSRIVEFYDVYQLMLSAQKGALDIQLKAADIIMIDEIHSLKGLNEAPRIMDALMKARDDGKVFVLTGYTDAMQGFLKDNPMFANRFPKAITIDRDGARVVREQRQKQNKRSAPGFKRQP